MLHRHEYKQLVWIDLECPTLEEVRQVANEFGINPNVADELLSPTLRPHTERYEDYLYLVLHFPTLQHPEHTAIAPEHEVDFIIGNEFIITTRYEELTTFVEFRSI